LVVSKGSSQGAIAIAKTSGPGAGVRLASTNVKLLVAAVAERVADAELETSKVGRLVHNHVVVTNAVSSAESRTSFSLTPVCAERASYTSKVLAGDVGLTTEVQLTPRIGAQTNGGLAVEQTAGRGVTRTDIKTAFQNEHGLETIAQIFGAFQAPAIAFAHAIDKTS